MRKALIICCLLAIIKPVLGQEPTVPVKRAVVQPNGIGGTGQTGNANQRGSKELPFVVDTEGHQQTESEHKQAQEKTDHTRSIEERTLFFYSLTAWSTFALCFIGIVGAVAAVMTLRRIKRQAELMNRQTVLIGGQLNEMRASGEQMKEMLSHAGTQASHMERQVGLMETQSKILRESVDAAKEAATAAIDKERARIRISVSDFVPPVKGAYFGTITYQTFCFGTTPAYIDSATCRSLVTSSLDPPREISFMPIAHNAPVWIPDHVGTKREDLVMNMVPELGEIKGGRQVLHFWGKIVYTDVFGKKRETTFRYRWRVTELKGVDGSPFCCWDKCGPEEDNKET